jgi:hypothetical protein
LEDDRSAAIAGARALTLAAIPVLGAIALLLVCFPPTRYGFYPPCPVRAWFGVLCPGCGATHAVSAMLRGEWMEAARANLLTVALSPLAGAFALYEAVSALVWNRWRAVTVPPLAIAALGVVAALFAVSRNG